MSGPGAPSPATSDPGVPSPATSDPGVPSPATSDPGVPAPATSDPRVPPPSLDAIGDRVATHIDTLLAGEAQRWAAVDPLLGQALASLRRTVATGGKRLRPAFCHWGYVAAGGQRSGDAVIPAAAAIELVHTAAVLHDDVVDGGTRRRGQPCLHVEQAGAHRREGWRGESRRFGEGVAILVGDLAFAYADGLMRGAPPAAVDVFTELKLEMNAGQLLDLITSAAGRAGVDQARTVARYKSGKYTVERPLHLGAAIAGRLDELAAPLSRFGVALGEAFQLRDDLLGAFGDPNVVGKGVGEDFREGKPTLLYAIARDRVSGADVELLDDRFGRGDLTDEEVRAIQRVLERTGARREVERLAAELTDQAVTALHAAPIDATARNELLALAHFVANRAY